MDDKKCVCRNRIVDKLVEECTKIVDENKIYNETLNTTSSNYSLSDCVSCAPYIVLFAVFLVTNAIISSVFIGIQKEVMLNGIMFVLSLIPTLKQQIIKCS